MNWTLLKLESNFRCDSAICQAANSLMACQPGRPDKQTVSATGEAGRVVVHEAGFETDDAEAHAVAEDIIRRHDGSGFVTNHASECAVLVRTNFLADYFRRVLKSHGLPVKEQARPDLPTDWRRARASLALLANPDNDRLAYQAVLLASGRQKADEVRRSALEYYQTINDTALFLPSGMLAGRAVDCLAKMGVSRESLERISRAAGLLAHDAAVNDLILALVREQADEVEGDGIDVRTLHAAKGGEWQAVWLPAWESETFPGTRKDTDVQEARRLAFVGITRAKSYLWISWAQRRAQQWGPPKQTTQSQFIRECL